MRTSFLAALGALAAHLVSAHYTFPDLIEADGTVSADWQYVRMTDNHYSNGPVTDVTSSQMKCYESTTASATSTYTVSAGATVGFKADNTMGHPGYFDAYLSLASPTANTESAGSGATWFKIWDWAPTYSASTGLVFDSEGITQVTFKIPSQVPSGQYLLRIEQIALHLSGTLNGAQLYIACAQLNIINGGNGTPGPFASFPGTYSATDPGILINIYSLPAGFTGYTPPGPPVWPAVSGGTTTKAATTTTTTKAATTTTTKAATTTTTTKAGGTTTKASSTTKAATTTGASGATQTQYGQCGGSGYTGPTVCASPYTCTVSSQYYSQCL